MHHPSSQSHIVSPGGQCLHYRRYGEGPPVVLLHESPRSTHVLDPLASHLARSFTVFAIDTPGYGLSDPLPLRFPEIDDFADAIAAAFDLLGLTGLRVYGTHTGSTIAAALGQRRPDLVSGLVLDGYPVFTPREREDYETSYLVPFEPAWDGSHVARLWSRVRDQYGFFPWYLRGQAAALPAPTPLDKHRAVFDDFLRAGPHYATAYAASFRFSAAEVYAALTVPCHVFARTSDLLHGHLDRLPPARPGDSIASCPAAQSDWLDRVADLMQSLPGAARTPAPPPAEIRRDGALQVAPGNQFFRFHDRGAKGQPLVLLHPLPGSGLTAADVARRQAVHRPVLVPELPGCGLTEASGDSDPLGATSAAIAALLDHLGLPEAGLLGLGQAARLTGALAARLPRLTAEPAPVPVPVPAHGWTPEDPPLPERWDGADLMALWYEIRQEELCAARAEDRVAGMDIARLHAAFVAHRLSRRGGVRLLDLACAPDEGLAS
ncbi:alpha/beta fold hydrolase [Marinibacterium profundimaris]|uniref:alpha/beta fold hydrolase n=1 Tax=Marinibacterium profundimaris TaxID=1679460 RepID=UPI001303A65E|nr:alpha/beta hydrolase [Marinibacterium profundimaris]